MVESVGYAPLVTRSAMLVVAAFSLLGVFRLAERVANTQVAIASTLCTALYPVFFCAKFAGAGGSGRSGPDFLGNVCISRGAAGRDGDLVFAGGSGERNGDSGADWRWPRGKLCALSCRSVWRRMRASCEQLWVDCGPDVRSGAQSGRIIPLLFPLLPLILWYGYPLRPHRIRLRQSRIFSLQRRLDPESLAIFAGSGAAACGKPSDTCICGC